MVVLALLLACTGCRPAIETQGTPETLVEEGYDQEAMDAAIARARNEVDVFIVALNSEEGTDFAVKAPITDNGRVEHFWLTDVRFSDGIFEGQIGNDPGVVRNVEFGQRWKIKREEISDWLFLRDGKMHGNYTVRPLLEVIPEGEAASIRAILAEP